MCYFVCCSDGWMGVHLHVYLPIYHMHECRYLDEPPNVGEAEQQKLLEKSLGRSLATGDERPGHSSDRHANVPADLELNEWMPQRPATSSKPTRPISTPSGPGSGVISHRAEKAIIDPATDEAYWGPEYLVFENVRLLRRRQAALVDGRLLTHVKLNPVNGIATVVGNFPVPVWQAVSYFEVYLVSAERNTNVVVGLTTRPAPAFRFPGSDV
jgi:hypothetical protein